MLGDLRNLETMGKSDPYVRVLLSGVEKGKTVTFQNNLNPDWDEVIYVPMHSTREKLSLEVMDQENLGKDRSLGVVELSAADYIHQADSGEYEVHDIKKPLSEPLRSRGGSKGTLNFTVAFYPTLNLVDPEEEEETEEKEGRTRASTNSSGNRPSIDVASRKSIDNGSMNGKSQARELGKFETSLSREMSKNEKEQEETVDNKLPPKLRLTPEELFKHGKSRSEVKGCKTDPKFRVWSFDLQDCRRNFRAFGGPS